jgi:nitroreductase
MCKELFDLPENEEPAVIIPLGYAADEMKPKSRKAIDEITEQRGQVDARINYAES